MQYVRDHEHLVHGQFRADDMQNMELFCTDVIKSGKGRYVSCTTLQFAAWYRQVVKRRDKRRGKRGLRTISQLRKIMTARGRRYEHL